MQTRKRLHISPLNAVLLRIALPPAVFPTASNISYHCIQTNPEHTYGYVEIDTTEGDKLKKKLNGAILRGNKMRVEDARPEKRVDNLEIHDETESQGAPKAKTERKRRRREEGVLPGVELPDKRKVKRGWTEPSSSLKEKREKTGKTKKENKSKPEKSKFSDAPECLFRTKLAPNVAEEVATKGEFKRKRNGKGKVVVHESSKTTKHANFLRTNSQVGTSNTTSVYVEGKGWVDQDGKVVEAEQMSMLRPRKIEQPAKQLNRKMKELSHDSQENDAQLKGSGAFIPGAEHDDSDATSSSGESEDSNNRSAGSSGGSEDILEDKPLSDEDHADLGVSSIGTATAPNVEPSVIETSNEVHPLEALFKRPKALSVASRKPNLELAIPVPFSFFDSGKKTTESMPPMIPHTPFTQRDLQWRGLRSAAPTPDTAAPGKGFGSLWGNSDDPESGDEDDDDDNILPREHGPIMEEGSHMDTPEGGEKPESDFAKWFWEHRGETNRAWKKRRRDVGKEKRQRDNKRRSKVTI